MDNMVWNVYRHNINGDKIEVFNVFNHRSFKHYTEKFLKECDTKEEFSDELRKELSYYFWCRAEYEIVIGPWVGGRTDGIKVDIYEQVMLNWEIFVDYVWSFKEATIEETSKPMEFKPCPKCGKTVHVKSKCYRCYQESLIDDNVRECAK